MRKIRGERELREIRVTDRGQQGDVRGRVPSEDQAPKHGETRKSLAANSRKTTLPLFFLYRCCILA